MNTTEKPCDQASDCATEGPFSAVVQEHIGWVYCAARRQLADTNLADDAVQAVFMALWQKRERLISNAQPIGGWLARATRYACNDLRKVQQRRENHERKAAAMRSEAVHGSGSNLEVPENSDLLLALDAAMQRLPSRDRDTLVARYFQNQSARQMAQAFDISEAAAEKRITRAEIKLRGIMAHKNIAMDSTALAALLSSGAGTAPNGLLAKVLQGVSGKAPVSVTAAHATRSIAFHTAHIPVIAGAAAVALAVGVAAVTPMALHDQAAKANGTTGKSPIPIGYTTTRLTGPLNKNGLVDYVAAFNQRFGKGVTPQNNAAVPLLILFRPMSFRGGYFKTVAGKMLFVRDPNWGHRLRQALGISTKYLTGPRFVSYQNFRKHADPTAIAGVVHAGGPPPDAPLFIPSKCYTRPWSARANPWVAAWVHANQGAIGVAEAATRRPRFFVPIIAASTLTPLAYATSGMEASGTGPNNPWEFTKSAISALTVRAMLELHRGNIKSCESYLLAAHQCEALLSQQHLLLTTMVASSADQMSSHADIALADSGKLTARQDNAYLRRLETLPKQIPIAADIDTSERWMLLSAFEIGALTNNTAGLPILAWETRWSRAPYARAMVKVNKFQDRLTATFKARSLIAQISGFRRDKSLWQGKSANAVTAFMAIQMRSDEGLISDQAGDIALSRMDRLSFALAAYLKIHGTFPNRLAELAPQYLPTIPHDPFTDKPFQYTTSPAGCTLRSPGKFARWLTFGGLRYVGRPIVVQMGMPIGKPKQQINHLRVICVPTRKL